MATSPGLVHNMGRGRLVCDLDRGARARECAAAQRCHSCHDRRASRSLPPFEGAPCCRVGGRDGSHPQRQRRRRHARTRSAQGRERAQLVSTESIEDASIDELSAVGGAMVKGVATQVDQRGVLSNAATSTVPAGLLIYALPGTGAGGKVDIDGILDAIGAIRVARRRARHRVRCAGDIARDPQAQERRRASTCSLLTARASRAPRRRASAAALCSRRTGSQLVTRSSQRPGTCKSRSGATPKSTFSSDAAFTNDSIVARVTMRRRLVDRRPERVLADLAMTSYRALVDLVVAGKGVEAGLDVRDDRRAGRARARVRARRGGRARSDRQAEAAGEAQLVEEGELMPAGWRSTIVEHWPDEISSAIAKRRGRCRSFRCCRLTRPTRRRRSSTRSSRRSRASAGSRMLASSTASGSASSCSRRSSSERRRGCREGKRGDLPRRRRARRRVRVPRDRAAARRGAARSSRGA